MCFGNRAEHQRGEAKGTHFDMTLTTLWWYPALFNKNWLLLEVVKRIGYKFETRLDGYEIRAAALRKEQSV